MYSLYSPLEANIYGQTQDKLQDMKPKISKVNSTFVVTTGLEAPGGLVVLCGSRSSRGGTGGTGGRGD